MKQQSLIFTYLAVILVCVGLTSCAQNQVHTETQQDNLTKNNLKKMKVEIWSDVMCPFCYIGKRKFETALQKFAQKEQIEIEWKSFQLNPDLKTDSTKSTVEHLAETKGWSLAETRNTISYVTNMAKEVGLNYDFDKAVVANSFDAHRIIQLAKRNGKADKMEELLFKAYFCEGKNTADHSVLEKLGLEAGLNQQEIKNALTENNYRQEVINDLKEADKLQINSVPFFVFNRKHAVAGAQDFQVFLDTLNKAWSEFSKN